MIIYRDIDIKQVQVDSVLTFFLSDGGALTIESPVWIGLPDAHVATAEELETLQGKTIELMELDDNTKRLTISTDESQLFCDPDERYESWDLNRGDGSKLVMQPGGNLVTWASQA